jgi:hypothetical protein
MGGTFEQALPFPTAWLRTGERSTRHHEPRTPSLDEALAAESWVRRTRNPELRKALGEIQAHVSEVRRLLALPRETQPLRSEKLEEQLIGILDATGRRLDIDAAWELASDLKRALLRLGDANYLAALLDREAGRDRSPGARHGWHELFPEDELTELRGRFRRGSVDTPTHARAVERLTALYLARADRGRSLRAKAAQKRRYLVMLAPVLSLCLAGLGVVVAIRASGIWPSVLLAASAGALGATLSGVRTVRDQLVELRDLRAFAPSMGIQPLVGATAGLLLLLVLESKAIAIQGFDSGSWAALGLLAFAAGFSEPFLLGVVRRIGVISDAPPDGGAKSGSGPRPAAS